MIEMTSVVLFGTEVEFEGSGTSPDGSIAKYEWDFDGDGDYDWESETSGSITHTYEDSRTYVPVLRVTDDFGATDTNVVQIEVLPKELKLTDLMPRGVFPSV